ncbi:histidine phosphatase family protein [Streptomyces sp. NPDC088354]|uniref:histidine phosphatase family protein n=1 Tax=Streptomyces sp. NPDC088354 TaxID=3365856 RepID=UPI0038297648
MAIHLTLLCAAAATSGREAVLADEPVGKRLPGRVNLPAFVAHPLTIRAPSKRCARTAEALGLEPTVEPALRDLDCGRWKGRTREEIAAVDPYGLSLWLTDPEAAPHGGESVRQLCDRAADWLIKLPRGTRPTLAVVEPAVVRALLVHALSAPARTFWHLDVRPLSAVSLVSTDTGWQVTPAHEAERESPRSAGGVPLAVHGTPFATLRHHAPLEQAKAATPPPV